MLESLWKAIGAIKITHVYIEFESMVMNEVLTIIFSFFIFFWNEEGDYSSVRAKRRSQTLIEKGCKLYGRKEERMEGRMQDVRKKGRKEGRKEERKEGRKKGRKERREKEKKEFTAKKFPFLLLLIDLKIDNHVIRIHSLLGLRNQF